MGDTSKGRMAWSGPRFRVLNGGTSGASLQVMLRKGDVLKAESDALVSSSAHVELGSSLDGGLFSAVLRSQLSSESMFFQTLTATADDQDVLLAAQLGDIVVLETQGTTQWKMVNGAFLAATDGVDVSTKTDWGVSKIAFGSGLFILQTSGSGTVAVASHGSMIHYTLQPGQIRKVDNGHVIAWTSNMDYKVQRASRSLFSSVASGEGMMCYFTGPGQIYIQSHKPQENDDSKGTKPKGSILGVCVFFLFVIVVLIAASFAEPDNGFEFEKRAFTRRTGKKRY